MVKLSLEEADYILINIKKLIEQPNTVQQKEIAEGIKSKILYEYNKRIEHSNNKTNEIKEHLEKLKESL